MVIPQPNLYTKKFKEISEEMVASIPKYTDRWTNHNPSDPGITILEMLAWIADTTLYRIDRIPEETYVTFLRLVAGAAGSEDAVNLLKKIDLDPYHDRSHRKILSLLKEVEDGKEMAVEEIKAAVLLFLGSRYRAITEEDFCNLAIEATDSDAFPSKVKRAIVSTKETKVEIIVVPDNWAEYESEELPETEKKAKYEELIMKVSDYLNPRRLVGTLVEVKKPVFTDVDIKINVVCSPTISDMKFEIVKKDVISRIESFLNPFTGGYKSKGWPYGRPLTVYEIAKVVEETDGIKRTSSLYFNENEKLTTIKTEGFIFPKKVSLTKEGDDEEKS